MNALPKPYYQEPGITLYCGDCRDIGIGISEKYCQIAVERLRQEVLLTV